MTTKDAVPSDAKKAKTAADSDAAVVKFRKWLWGIYTSFIKEMLEWLHAKDENLQVAALRTLMEFVSRESVLKNAKTAVFGNETFARVVQQIMALPQLKGKLEGVLKGEYVGAYADVQYFLVRIRCICDQNE